MMSGSASVSYAAAAFPVNLEFTGTTFFDGIDNIQIGQKLTAKVVGIPAEVNYPEPGTPPDDTYTWTRPEGRPFLNYNPDVLPTVFEDWHDPGTKSMITYFGRASSAAQQIRCAVSLPRYELSLVVTRQIAIHVPKVEYRELPPPGGGPRIDRMYLLSQPVPPLFVEDPVDPDAFKLWGVVPLFSVTPNYKVGAYMNLKVGSPSGFGLELGQWIYTQVVSVKLHGKHKNGNDQVHNSDWGVEGLDGGFPYPGDGGPHGAGVIDEDGNVDDVFGHQWADSPGLESIRQALLDWTWWYTRWDFKLFIFYLPRGAGSKWVPLRRYSWRCGVTATKGAQSWILTNQTNAFGMFTQDPDPFPMWTHRHGTFEWVPGPPPQ